MHFSWFVVNFEVEHIDFGRKIALDLPQTGTKVVRFWRPFRGKVQVLGVAGDVIQESQDRATIKGFGLHGPCALQTLQNSYLQILTHQAPGRNFAGILI